MTAQFVASNGSQIAASIDEKLCVGEIVFLGEAMEERRCGVCPTAAVNIDVKEKLRFGVDSSVEPLRLAINLDLVLVDGDPPINSRTWRVTVTATNS